jgi:hypothetical protein
MEQKYYLPISSTSLAHYFGCACIKPSKYFENKQEDLQDKFNDFLLVTTHFGTQQTDCCLELVFTKKETDNLIDVKNGFYLYEKPLPITRVRKIYFTDKERKEQTITNIIMSTAFVPEELVEVTKNGFDDVQTDKLEKPQDIYICSYEKQIQTFNNLLGGFALLKNSGDDDMNYSENYFASLSTYLDIATALNKTDKRFRNLFKDSLYEKVKPFLRDKIDENILTNEAQKEGQKIIKNLGLIDLSKLQGVSFILAVLNLYGVAGESKRKNIDDLILLNFHTQEIKSDLSEITALCYGLNRGYAAFINSYKVGNSKKEVKFRLNSQLDYYTIESLYQYSFNPQEKNSTYSYLDWCPRYKNTVKANKINYQILDVVVIGKKKAKVLSKEYWANLLPSFLQSNKFTERTLPQIYQELGEVVFNDAKDEIADNYENQIAQKQEEIDSLKAEQKKLLQEIQKPVIPKEYKQQEEQSTPTVAEPTTSYLPKQDIDIKNIVEQTLKYKEKNQTMLKNEAKEKGIAIPKGMKQDDIIVLLMTTKNNNLFGNEQLV